MPIDSNNSFFLTLAAPRPPISSLFLCFSFLDVSLFVYCFEFSSFQVHVHILKFVCPYAPVRWNFSFKPIIVFINFHCTV